MPKLEIDDVVVLLLGCPTEKPELEDKLSGVTRLEKLVFLVEQETSLGELLDEDANFIAYNFGPFSAAVYQAVDSLSGYGLLEDSASLANSDEDSWEQIRVVGVDRSDPYATRNFELTERGKQYYRVLTEEISDEYIDELVALKEQFGSIPLRQLVRYVYQEYPDMTENSLIRDDILNR
ncbi:MAG: hypothetical protein OXT07_11515 [bacterium]|nr:hypothetical protein [bacterium]